MPNELKPCPFCGSTDVKPGDHIAYCNSCTNMTSYSTPNKWNRRAMPECVRELIKFAKTYATPAIGVGEYTDIIDAIESAENYYGGGGHNEN